MYNYECAALITYMRAGELTRGLLCGDEDPGVPDRGACGVAGERDGKGQGVAGGSALAEPCRVGGGVTEEERIVTGRVGLPKAAVCGRRGR